ncbi:metallophosphoesterase [Bacillus andreraoultii]|uniref:metallophosphoesterase n=1 Tax=Bacillus andreraoultii TaxID=1499685 RepID=UPI000539B930|nr:metallophosphoesterase [Bacillus andreraoultii]
MEIITIITLVCFAVLLIYMWLVAKENRIVEHELHYQQFPQSLKELQIFFISDIHRRVISEEMINEVKGRADLVIIGGDITERGVPYARTEENIRRLRAIGPTYFVWGNNDFEKNVNQLEEIFRKYQVTILEDSHAVISTNEGDKIYLIGIGEHEEDEYNLDDVFQPIEKEAFKIVVCHKPDVKKHIKEEDHISLLLCGHTHGGQIRIFGMGPYSKGKLHRTRTMDMLISNGYGTTSLPLRLSARPETHLIKITR